MNIALLGGTGFVGQNVGEVLSENDFLFNVASLSEGVDLRKTQHCLKFFSQVQPEYIINCAANVGSLNYVTEQAADVISDNSRMILSIYEAISKSCPRAIIINPIANCAYPAEGHIYSEDSWWDGPLHRSVLSFGATRRLMWAVGESYAMQYGIKSVHLLVPNMYGPFDSTDPNKAHALNALVSKFVKAEKTNQKELEIWGTGSAIREWLYAKDFGRIVLEVIRDPHKPEFDEPINIAQNFGLSVKELVQIIIDIFEYHGAIRWNNNMPDGAPKKVMDDRKFRKVFPDFKFMHLSEGIKNTVKYYESIYPY